MFDKWRTDNINECTHLDLSGGKMNIPENHIPEFIKLYVELFNAGVNLFICEKLGNSCTFRMFYDLDFKRLCLSDIQKTEVLSSVVSHLQTDLSSSSTCIQGCGFHIVTKNETDCENAIQQCNALKVKLMNESPHLPWSDIIDSSVYKTALRMIGSKKFQRSEVIDRYYTLFTQKKVNRLTPGILEKSLVRIKSKIVSIQKVIIKSEETDLHKYFVKLHAEYADIKYTMSKNEHGYIIVNTNSKFCTNLGKEHKSNKIYFVISPDRKLYQKCFCTCETKVGRKRGFCRDYKSKSILLPKQIFESITK
tara:strand:- start:607 stop:1527 length:921 start_codon:yes stop_codon:yes gene_type:complete